MVQAQVTLHGLHTCDATPPPVLIAHGEAERQTLLLALNSDLIPNTTTPRVHGGQARLHQTLDLRRITFDIITIRKRRGEARMLMAMTPREVRRSGTTAASHDLSEYLRCLCLSSDWVEALASRRMRGMKRTGGDAQEPYTDNDTDADADVHTLRKPFKV